MSIVLDVIQNDSYEPSEAELLEYGKWLGMKFPEERPFLWIAREGLKAPLPEHWKACKSEKGELYYFNFKTGESNWDHPLDEKFKELFESERKNPSPQSIANGAKKKSIQDNAMDETVTEETEPKASCKPLPGGKSKLKTLKSLKLKKELPDELRVDPKAGSNSNSDCSERCLESVRLVRTTSYKGSLNLKQSTETPSAENHGEYLKCKSDVTEGDLSDKLKNFQSKKLKEHQATKDEYEMKLKDSWNRFQEIQTEEYEKKVKALTDELDRKLVEKKNELEEGYAKNVQQLTKDAEASFELEGKRIRKYLTEKYEKEKENIEQQCETELLDFRKSKNIQFDRLRALESQSLAGMNQISGEVFESAMHFLEAYKKAQDKFLDGMESTNVVFSKFGEMALDRLVDHAKELYDTELNTIKKSFQIEIDELRRKFAIELGLYERKRELLTEEEKQYEKEREELLKRQSSLFDCRNSKPSSVHATLWHRPDSQESPSIPELGEEKRVISVSSTGRESAEFDDDTTGARSEKELLDFFVTYIKEAQRKELEDVKRDLKQLAGEELKLALGEVVREQRLHLRSESLSEEKDGISSLHGAGKISPDIKTDDKESGKAMLTISLSDTTQKDNLASLLTEALRTVFAGSPFIISSHTSADPSAKNKGFFSPPIPGTEVETKVRNSCNVETVSIPNGSEAKKVEKSMDGFPVSFQEQKLLIARERQQVAEGKKFVETQRLNLEERRYQLKMARHQWKQDVRSAKEEGVRASSKRGQLLNKLRVALDNQSKGLDHDETILCDNERWLLMKERSVYQMEQHINEIEGGKGHDISINSIDTVALMTGFFKSTIESLDLYPQNRHAAGQGGGGVHKRSLSPIYAKTLDKIARRLEEVTSMLNVQQQKRSFSLPHENFSRQRSRQRRAKGSELIFT